MFRVVPWRRSGYSGHTVQSNGLAGGDLLHVKCETAPDESPDVPGQRCQDGGAQTAQVSEEATLPGPGCQHLFREQGNMESVDMGPFQKASQGQHPQVK